MWQQYAHEGRKGETVLFVLIIPMNTGQRCKDLGGILIYTFFCSALSCE